MSGVAHLADDRAHGDDAAAALFQHRPHRRLRQDERRGEIGGEDGVPVVALHSHQQLIARDARIADEDVEPAVPFDDAGRHAFEGAGVGDVDAQRLGPMTGRGDLVGARLRVIAARGRDHGRALCRQPHGNRASDAARRPRDERDFA